MGIRRRSWSLSSSSLSGRRRAFRVPVAFAALGLAGGAAACGDSDPSPVETFDAAQPAADAGPPFDPGLLPDGAAGDSSPSPPDDGGLGDAAPTPPVPPMGMEDGGFGGTPAAKGLWIWYFDYIGMTAADAAKRAKADGVGYVLIKSGQDGSFWDTRLTKAAVQEFTSRGMKVLAWPYFTPSGGKAAVAAAAKAMAVPGVSGLVLDVEVEWEGNHAADAAALCKGIRAAVPGVYLGYTSFGWPGYHASFPWKAFDKDCGDGAWPQVYFSDRGVAWDGKNGISEAVAQYKSLGLKAPFWPIASNDTGPGYPNGPSTAELNGFLDQTGARSSLWEFPAKGLTARVNQLAQLHWKNDAGP